MAYFSQFNREFLFDLPQELLDLPNDEKYMKIAVAAETYGTEDVVPIIAFGISTNHSKDAVSERNAWVATKSEMINIPEHQIPEVEKMMADRNAVKLCKEGHLGVQIIPYTNQWGKQYKVKWMDI